MAIPVLALVLVTTYDVVWRYALVFTLVWPKDIEIFLYGSLMLLSTAYVLRLRQHIRVDYLVKRYLSRRGEEIILLIGYIFFFLPFVLVTLIYGWEMFIVSAKMGEHFHSGWNPPIYPYKFVIPLFAFMLLLQGIAEIVRHFVAAVKGGRNEP